MKDFLIDFFSKHPGNVNTPLVSFAVCFIVSVVAFCYATFYRPSLFDTGTFDVCLGIMFGGTGLPLGATIIKGATSAINPKEND
jgi:hypothetical protein